jgi:hypothetical protein
MGARIRCPSLVASFLISAAWASTARAQTAPPPSSWGTQSGQKTPAAQPAAPPPPAAAPSAPAAPAPAAPAPATASFPATTTTEIAPAPAPPTPITPAPTPGPAEQRQARVRFNANEPGAVLESDVTPDGKPAAWYVVCEAPCTGMVSKSGAFRVGGAGYHPSRLFRLPEERSDFKIDAEMETSSIAVPMAVTIVGGVIASAGGFMLLAAYAEDQQTFRNTDDLVIPGAITAGTGTVIATVGVLMLIVDAQHDESKARVAEAARGFTF